MRMDVVARIREQNDFHYRANRVTTAHERQDDMHGGQREGNIERHHSRTERERPHDEEQYKPDS